MRQGVLRAILRTFPDGLPHLPRDLFRDLLPDMLPADVLPPELCTRDLPSDLFAEIFQKCAERLRNLLAHRLLDTFSKRTTRDHDKCLEGGSNRLAGKKKRVPCRKKVMEMCMNFYTVLFMFLP